MSPTPKVAKYTSTRERRTHPRYMLATTIEYSIRNHRGVGVARNISSNGILIQTAGTLPAGHPVRLYVDWPTPVGSSHRVRLVITGRVLRTTERGTAVRILKHNYQLRRRGAVRLAKAG